MSLVYKELHEEPYAEMFARLGRECREEQVALLDRILEQMEHQEAFYILFNPVTPYMEGMLSDVRIWIIQVRALRASLVPRT